MVICNAEVAQNIESEIDMRSCMLMSVLIIVKTTTTCLRPEKKIQLISIINASHLPHEIKSRAQSVKYHTDD